MSKSEAGSFYPKTRKQWRAWLQKNHEAKDAVWLVCYKISSGRPNISWSEAVEEALCFGWIDSTRRPVDEDHFIQFFSKRKARSTWSKINKDKVERLISEGLMTEAGLNAIETAKKNGSWSVLDAVEAMEIPKDLLAEFKKWKGSKEFFLGLSKSVKKMMLHRIELAKLPETRKKRITEIARMAAEGKVPV